MMHGHAMVLRVIVTEVLHIDALGLPLAVHQVLTKKSGLVLVTGQTVGKSTSLAAMIDKINRERNENIITVEDPIESASEQEVDHYQQGGDMRTFASALKGALRQDPDIIPMGELRDHETVSTARRRRKPATRYSARFTRTARRKQSTGSLTCFQPRAGPGTLAAVAVASSRHDAAASR